MRRLAILVCSALVTGCATERGAYPSGDPTERSAVEWAAQHAQPGRFDLLGRQVEWKLYVPSRCGMAAGRVRGCMIPHSWSPAGSLEAPRVTYYVYAEERETLEHELWHVLRGSWHD